MPSVTSKTLAYITAVQFREGFYEPSPEVGYVFIGKHTQYPNEASPSSISDSIFDEKTAWDNMYAAKKITGNDVELVIPRFNWTSGKKYKQYDDLIDYQNLIEPDNNNDVNPFYVITSSRNVYKCLSNNRSALSTVEPSGDYTSSNGNIATSDGYIWKYMYNVKPSNKFLTDEWIPVPTSVSQLDYGVSILDVVDGELTTIVMTNQGSGYKENVIRIIDTFSSGCTILTLANTDGVAANMSISGTGITVGSYITSVGIVDGQPQLTLSTPTTSAGGGNTSQTAAQLTTRVYIDGDGTSTVAGATINTATYNVTSITVNSGATAVNSWIQFYNTSKEPDRTSFALPNARVFVNSTGHVLNVTIYSAGSHTDVPVANVAALRYYENNSILTATSNSNTNAVFTVSAIKDSRIEKITVTTIGTDYSRANVFVYGTGSNAAARAIMDMKYGHAANPAKELVANSVMICVRMGEIDSTEGGKVPSNTTFRQYGVFVNPHKYGESLPVSPTNANSVISQTTLLTLVAGGSYSLNEFVYQGTSPATATASGFVLYQTSNEVKITGARGTFESGVLVVGANSSTQRLLVSAGTPEFEPYSGDMVYIENDSATQRYDGQAENIRLIVRF